MSRVTGVRYTSEIDQHDHLFPPTPRYRPALGGGGALRYTPGAGTLSRVGAGGGGGETNISVKITLTDAENKNGDIEIQRNVDFADAEQGAEESYVSKETLRDLIEGQITAPAGKTLKDSALKKILVAARQQNSEEVNADGKLITTEAEATLAIGISVNFTEIFEDADTGAGAGANASNTDTDTESEPGPETPPPNEIESAFQEVNAEIKTLTEKINTEIQNYAQEISKISTAGVSSDAKLVQDTQQIRQKVQGGGGTEAQVNYYGQIALKSMAFASKVKRHIKQKLPLIQDKVDALKSTAVAQVQRAEDETSAKQAELLSTRQSSQDDAQAETAAAIEMTNRLRDALKELDIEIVSQGQPEASS